MSDPRVILDGIENKLLDLPEAKFVEVVHLLEQISDHPRVRETFQAIRPRIARVRPPRHLTLRRVFCDPFEDLLLPSCDGTIPLRPIDRSIIQPLWHVVESCTDPDELMPLRRQAAPLSDHDIDARYILGCRLWPIACRTLRRALADIDGDPRLLGAFVSGGEERLAQARDIVELLDVGHAVSRLKRALGPKPRTALSDSDVVALGELVHDVARRAPHQVLHLLLIAGSRLLRPAELLTALEKVDFGKARRTKADVCATLSGLVVSSLETAAAALPDDGERPVHPGAVMDRAERLLDGLVAARGLPAADALASGRLDGVRDAVRTMVVDAVLDPAEDSILDSLPVLPPDGRRLDIPDPVRQERAEDSAAALRRCEALAAGLGLEDRVGETLASIGTAVDARLLALATLADSDEGAGEALHLSIAYALRLLELVRGLGAGGEARFDPIQLLLSGEGTAS